MTALTSDAAYARHSIAKGSQSFAAASRLLPKDVRDDVARLYAWCRYADDVIDGQDHGHNGGARTAEHAERHGETLAGRLADLRRATDAALALKRSGDPVFDGFGDVAHRHGITPRLAHDLLDGFAMDVSAHVYRTADDLYRYCYGVAGAVGVMMALVIGVDRSDSDTLDRACDLGLAFQMTNIARDIIADAHEGRVYLPEDWLAAEGLSPDPAEIASAAAAPAVHKVAVRLVREADRYYASARVGVRRLPFRVAWAIASAGQVYRAIGRRRVAMGPAELPVRARTNTPDKVGLILAAIGDAVRSDERGLVQDRAGMWQRPERP